ncbi:MAG TPA: NADH-quinone oxidoreductase subunit G [Nocardioidaceae bacterium]|nr:NADH-quinone oxidoreductase subunit G [Nocardioidaceae bacterium]
MTAETDTGREVVRTVTLTIDGVPATVPEGTLVIRAAEMIGIQIPRFCDHPLLDPIGACRQCLVEIPDAGNGRPMPKPQASCTIPVTEGMVVRTQHSSPVADKAQQGQMEFLLINHPLDCPMCDKGGECPLQNQAMSNGRGETRYREPKRTYLKPLAISSEVLLDRERCILCTRCTRFSEQIPGDPFITMNERGYLQQVAVYQRKPFDSYFSGNTIQICPVGALTSTTYRFRSRPYDLVSTPTICEHCASGCALRTDWRRGKVMRRLAGDDPEVNEEWNCDKGRFAFMSARLADRLTGPRVRDDETGELRPASWPEAFAVAARGLAAAGSEVGVLTGGRIPSEDAYAYGKLARAVLGTNDIDFRARAASPEEAEFLAAQVAARPGPSYADLERANTVLLVGFEPEEESPIVFLRLRKAVDKHGTAIYSIASHTSRGLSKMSGHLIRSRPGDEANALSGVGVAEVPLDADSVILTGERLATVPGALAAAAALARSTGAKLGWVPRRAGERGALEGGALPNLLPGGRPLGDASARVDLGVAWGVEALPVRPGRDGAEILAAAAGGDLRALVVGGLELDDLPDPAAAAAALDAVGFLVSLEVRESAVTERADVVFPVAPVAERSGSFVDWEGRVRPFPAALDSQAMPDVRVLAGIADEMGRPLGFRTPEEARAEMTELGPWDGSRGLPDPAPKGPAKRGTKTARSRGGETWLLSTWRMLIDDSRAVDGEPYLAGTARPVVAVVSSATLDRLGLAEGDAVVVTTDAGAVTLSATAGDIDDDVVWLPANSAGVNLRRDLGVGAGDAVRLGRPAEGGG